MLSLFLMFLFAFIFFSLITHICFSVILNKYLGLRFFIQVVYSRVRSKPRPDSMA